MARDILQGNWKQTINGLVQTRNGRGIQRNPCQFPRLGAVLDGLLRVARYSCVHTSHTEVALMNSQRTSAPLPLLKDANPSRLVALTLELSPWTCLFPQSPSTITHSTPGFPTPVILIDVK